MSATLPVEGIVRDVQQAMALGEGFRKQLPPDGRVWLDRPLPYLCLYQPGSGDDEAAERIIAAHAAYLIVPRAWPGDRAHRLISGLAASLVERFGAACLIEMRLAREEEGAERTTVHRVGCPLFVLETDGNPRWHETVEALTRALESIEVEGKSGAVRTRRAARPPLAPTERQLEARTCFVGIEVEPVFREIDSGALCPLLLESLRARLTDAIRVAVHRFAHAHTRYAPASPGALGPRQLDRAALDADELLVAAGDAFEFLLQLTPGNLQQAWQEMAASGFEREPRLDYRPLAVDPAVLKRMVFWAPVEEIDDPSLAQLMREKQEELDRRVSMLRDRGDRFLYESLEIHGYPEPRLIALAHRILEELDKPAMAVGPKLEARAVVRRAEEAVAAYRLMHRDFEGLMELRDDIAAGLMVSRGKLLIHRDVRISERRIEALIEHEIGTHMVTWFNGKRQPLQLFGRGLAGYEVLQEGLAALAEHLVGGLTAARLRMFAARVITARMIVDGAGFLEVFRELRRLGFSELSSFQTTVRSLRGGGMTKDIAYLKGLLDVVDYLKGGGAIDPLYVGKIAISHLDLVEELTARGALHPPAVRPRFLHNPAALRRLAELRSPSRSSEDEVLRMACDQEPSP